MKKVPQRGDLITLKTFAFTNKSGGTGMSTWKHDDRYFTKKVTVKVTKEWEDYECGQRGWAVPLPDDKELNEILNRYAKGKTLYWSEFDIMDVKEV